MWILYNKAVWLHKLHQDVWQWVSGQTPWRVHEREVKKEDWRRERGGLDPQDLWHIAATDHMLPVRSTKRSCHCRNTDRGRLSSSSSSPLSLSESWKLSPTPAEVALSTLRRDLLRAQPAFTCRTYRTFQHQWKIFIHFQVLFDR